MSVETIADFYRETEFGRVLHHRGHDEGLEEGLEKGLKTGLGRFACALEAAIRDRFGDHIESPEIAERLAHCPVPVAAIHAIAHATSFQDLVNFGATSTFTLAT
ncbi:MAG TPA: hypothetical protein VLL08_20665 [Kineosporiaceae bacterium]|nr:hypothetical protein [Kineosporiaceae bacterium]